MYTDVEGGKQRQAEELGGMNNENGEQEGGEEKEEESGQLNEI